MENTKIEAEIQTDVCVVGNGAVSFWAVQGYLKKGCSVFWLATEEPSSAFRLMQKHAWCWNLLPQEAEALSQLLGQPQNEAFPSFEALYYDARNSKVFKPLEKSRVDWGDHEKDWLPGLLAQAEGLSFVDFSKAHNALLESIISIDSEVSKKQGSPAIHEVSVSPRLLIGRSLRMNTLVFENEKIIGLDLLNIENKDQFSLKAGEFVFGEVTEVLASLTEDQTLTQKIRQVQKGRRSLPGLSFEFLHKPGMALSEMAEKILIIPLVANPSTKGAGAHVIGRIGAQESTWFSLLTEEEVEDNNEILKKIKTIKRALERTFPEFLMTIQNEIVSFEPHMMAMDLRKKKETQIFGAHLLNDVFGPREAVQGLQGLFDRPHKTETNHAATEARLPRETVVAL